MAQGGHGTLLWPSRPIPHRQTFSKDTVWFGANEKHGMYLICHASLTINRLCFSKNKK